MDVSLDLQAEYDNRARVPEHPAFLEAWARDAARYRLEAGVHALLDIAYGARERAKLDLFVPEGAGEGPVALFVHGGYWQALGKSSFSHIAAGAVAHGITVAVAGYTLCPDVGIGDIVDEIDQAVLFLARRFGRPLVVYGHSAGGHLAVTAAAADWRAKAPDLPFDPVAAALPVSGLFDLVPLTQTSVNDKLRLDEATAERLSPVRWPAPRGKRIVAVVGGAESGEYLRQTRDLVARWGEGGAHTREVVVPGAHHFDVIGPFADPASDLTRGLVALAKG